MLVRWIAAGLHEARRSFRRVRGHAELTALIRALDQPNAGQQEGGRIDAHSPEPPLGAFNSERDIPTSRNWRAGVVSAMGPVQ